MTTKKFDTTTTSLTQPPAPKIGDEWFNPSTNILYKYLAISGTAPQWIVIYNPNITTTTPPTFQVGIGTVSDVSVTFPASVALNTKIIDTANAFNTTTNVYVVPTAGLYNVNFSIYFTNSSTQTQVMGVGIVINGAFQSTPNGDAYGCILMQPNAFASGIVQVGGQALYLLRVGDTIGLKPRGGNALRISQASCYMSGYMVYQT